MRSWSTRNELPSLTLGASVRHEWDLDWERLTTNHGSYGATPRAVLGAQQEWRRKLEEQPTLFMRRVLPAALRHSADRIGQFVGAEGQDVVFVENATTGCNAVLRSLPFTKNDEILISTHTYGAVRNTVRYIAELSGARVVEAEIPFPHADRDAIVANIAAALTERTRLAVIDHISSHS